MGKIVGNAFVKWACYTLVFLLCSISWYVRADIAMRAVDTDGSVLQQAGIGQPFVLEVTMRDMNQSMQAPSIAGLKDFNVRRTGFVYFQNRLELDP